MQRALMHFKAGQCGLDAAKAGLPKVQATATTNRLANYEHIDVSGASLYNASTLNIQGLPYDYIRFIRIP